MDDVTGAGLVWMHGGVRAVRFEPPREALGIGESRPRISWKVATDIPGWTQSAYEIEIGAWSSGRIESAESVLVAWDAPPLASRERRAVRVGVWSADGASDWSEPA